MRTKVKTAISISPTTLKMAEELCERKGKTFSGLVQDLVTDAIKLDIEWRAKYGELKLKTKHVPNTAAERTATLKAA